jgi:hypothetical protein
MGMKNSVTLQKRIAVNGLKLKQLATMISIYQFEIVEHSGVF